MNNEVIKEQIDYLKRFRQEVSSTRKVDKNMVISLEQFIGENIITTKLNVNKLPNTPRDMYIEDVVNSVDTKVKDMEASIEAPSRAEIIDTMHHMLHSTTQDLFMELSIFLYFNESKRDYEEEPSKSLANKIISAMTNEKYIYRYDGETLTDITTLPIDVLYGKYKDYIIDVHLELTGKPLDPNEFESLSEDKMSSICPYYNFLLALLKCDKTKNNGDSLDYVYNVSYYMEKNSPKQITIRDVVEIAENAYVLSKLVEVIKNDLAKRLSNAADTFFVDNVEYSLYKKLENSNNTLRFGVVPTTIRLIVKNAN